MKKLLLLMLCLIFAMSMVLSSCNKREDVEDDDKTTDDDQDDDDDQGNQGNKPACDNHVGTVICENCFTALYSFAEIPAVPDIDTIGMKLTDFSVVINEDEYNREGSGTLTADVAEAFVGLTDDGKLYGYGTASLTLDYKNYAREDTLAAKVFIEDNKVYVVIDGTEFGSSSQQMHGVYFVDINRVPELMESEAQLNSAANMLAQYAPVVTEWLTGSLLPVFENVDISGVTNVTGKYTAKLINAFYKVTKNSDGTTDIAFSFDTIKAWNRTLAEKPISEVVDLVAGAGSYAKIESLLADDKLYNFSVADAINYLKTEQGVDLAVILNKVDELISTITEGEITTIEALLEQNGVAIPGGYEDLNEILADEEILALSVKDALKLLMHTETPEAAVEQVKAMAANLLTSFKSVSLYQYIMGMGGQASPAPMSADASDINEAIDEMIDEVEEMLDDIAEYFTFTMKANASNVITNVNFTANIDIEDEDAAVDFSIIYANNTTKISAAVEIEGESVGSCQIVADSDSVAITYDVDVDGSGSEGTYELILGHTMSYDKAELEAAKAKIADTKTKITAKGLYDALTDTHADNSYYKVFLDAAENKVYRIYLKDVDFGDESLLVSVEVNVFDVNELFALGVMDGCTNVVSIVPVFMGLEAYVDIVVTDNEESDYVELVTLDAVKAALAEDDNVTKTPISTEMLYNSATGVYFSDEYEHHASGLGHSYTLTSKHADNDSCTEIYWEKYTCSVCGDTYTYYYALGHSMNSNYYYPDTCNTAYTRYYSCSREFCSYSYTEADKTGHQNTYTEYNYNGNGFSAILDCTCGDFETKHVGDFTITSDLAYSPYFGDTNDFYYNGGAIQITINESNAGTYTLYSDSGKDYVDTILHIYIYDTVNGNLHYQNYYDVGAENGNYSTTYEFTAGYTYVIAMGHYSSNPGDFEFNAFIEKN